MSLSGDNPHSCFYHAGPDMEYPAGIHYMMMSILMIRYDSSYLRSLTTTHTYTSQVRTIHAERESLDLQVEANFIIFKLLFKEVNGAQYRLPIHSIGWILVIQTLFHKPFW